MLISASLHNSLVILSLVIFVVFLVFVGLKQLRGVWQHINIIYTPSPTNVLLLQSCELSELRNVLSSVDDEIDIHPRQIRRILRQALDSNVVKDVAISKPDFFIKHSIFHKNNNEYIFKFKHYIKEQEGTMCLDFYFGVPKCYYFQIKSLTKLHEKPKKHKPLSPKIRNQNNINIASPLKSVIGLASQPQIQRISSKSFQSKTSPNEGIQMTEMTEMAGIKQHSASSMITLQKLIPNDYVYRDFVESKSGEDISFEENDLETTINSIIGKTQTQLIQKQGPSTKYKTAVDDDDDLNGEGFYFCVLLSYIRYTVADKKESESEQSDESDDELQKEEEKEEINADDIDYELVNNYELICENGINYKIETLEISIFDPPSAFSAKNQHKKKDKKGIKAADKNENENENENVVNVVNALEPQLCIKLLCDFNFQRLVEYYDIFGISSDIDNNEIKLDCKICFSFAANIILLPCRHCCCCLNCYKHIETCPMCRKPIRQTLRWKNEPQTSIVTRSSL